MLEDGLRRLGFRSGSAVQDAVFLHLLDLEIDPDEVLRNRLKMKMQLTRYLHIGDARDPDLGWGGRSTRELRRMYATLVEILKEESPECTATEQ